MEYKDIPCFLLTFLQIYSIILKNKEEREKADD